MVRIRLLRLLLPEPLMGSCGFFGCII
jgi:hypothetical protein